MQIEADRTEERLNKIVEEIDCLKCSTTTRERVSGTTVDYDRVHMYVAAKIEAEEEAEASRTLADNASRLLELASAGLTDAQRAAVGYEYDRHLHPIKPELTRYERKRMGKAAAELYDLKRNRQVERHNQWFKENLINMVMAHHSIGEELRKMGIRDWETLRNRL